MSTSTWATTQRQRGRRATRRRASSRPSSTSWTRCSGGAALLRLPGSWMLAAASAGHLGTWQPPSLAQECKVGRLPFSQISWVASTGLCPKQIFVGQLGLAGCRMCDGLRVAWQLCRDHVIASSGEEGSSTGRGARAQQCLFPGTTSYGRSSPSHLGEAGPETPSLCQDWLCQMCWALHSPAGSFTPGACR